MSREGEPEPVEYSQSAFNVDEAELARTFDERRARHLQEALAAYNVDVVTLRDLVSQGADVFEALRSEKAPPEAYALLAALAALLRPLHLEQIRRPADLAALLMVDMGFLQQEQMKVACLDTKNRLQKLHMVYQGNVNTSMIRMAELFREPIRLNSAAIIIAHNHPSSDPMPSPEDVLVTREVVEAGELLDIDVLDHLVIGQGRWVSMRERGLGFSHYTRDDVVDHSLSFK